MFEYEPSEFAKKKDKETKKKKGSHKSTMVKLNTNYDLLYVMYQGCNQHN